MLHQPIAMCGVFGLEVRHSPSGGKLAVVLLDGRWERSPL